MPADNKSFIDKALSLFYRIVPHQARFYGDLQSSSSVKNYHEKLDEFLASLKAGSRVLDLGSGNRKIKRAGLEIISFDSIGFELVDVVGSAEDLPFEEAEFDAIILQQVLEHVERPEAVLAEAKRVMKPQAVIWVEVPFIFLVHGGQYGDYWRWTQSGLSLMCRKFFDELGGGPVMGAGSALSVVARASLCSLFSFGNKYLYHISLFFVALLTFWLKYLDAIVKPNRYTEFIAPAIHFIGIKGDG